MDIVDKKVHIDFRIRSDQLKFMKENGIERSSWIRQRLRDAIDGRRDYPIGSQRRNCSHLTPTSATIAPSQKRFIDQTGLNVSLFIDQEIDKLIERLTKESEEINQYWNKSINTGITSHSILSAEGTVNKIKYHFIRVESSK
jgi:hypothetical protein